MKTVKIRSKLLVEMDDIEITNLYCALIVYTNQLTNPILKEKSQKQLDDVALIMRELGL